jgi:hypothetical protein
LAQRLHGAWAELDGEGSFAWKQREVDLAVDLQTVHRSDRDENVTPKWVGAEGRQVGGGTGFASVSLHWATGGEIQDAGSRQENDGGFGDEISVVHGSI